MSPEELSELQILQAFSADKLAYNDLHSTQPQTLAHALADSPVGQLAWSYQLFGPTLDPDFVLGNVALYWFTRTTASSMRGYWENHHAQDKPTGPTTTPLGVAAFAGDFSGIRRFADRDHSNIVSWNTYDRGGHYPSIGAAEELVGDLRAFAQAVSTA
jgi:epoxide hydrolase